MQIRTALDGFGIGMTGELGFNNTYALVMRRDTANRLGIQTISDLRAHPELKFGLTHEFLDRRDGWRPAPRALRIAGAQCSRHRTRARLCRRFPAARST